MHHLGVPTTRALSLVATGEAGRARHVLRRPSARPSRARSCAASRRRSSASATSSCRRRAATWRCCKQLVDFTHPPRFPGAGSGDGADEQLYARVVRAGLRAHRAHGRALDARRLRARRDEHRQHVDPRPHHRLRPVRLDRQLRPRLDAEHHRRAGPPLPLRPAAADRVLEPRRGSRNALAPAVRVGRSAARRAAALRGRVHRRRSRQHRGASSGLPNAATRTSSSCRRCTRCCRRAKST